MASAAVCGVASPSHVTAHPVIAAVVGFSHCVSTQRGNPSCTFHTSGRVGVAQRWYRCLTCDHFTDANHKGCCAPCASKCHVGHRLVDKGTQFGYCDCGAERLCDSEVGGTVCAGAIFHRVPRDTTAEL
jgi:hypothetical protein